MVRVSLAPVGIALLFALVGCGGSDSAATPSDAGGPPACSDFAHGEVLIESLAQAGCTGHGVTATAANVCPGGASIIAVGPVNGFVGKAANYLGDGVDATTSSQWKAFQQDCPADGE